MELQIFQNPQLGEVRTVLIDGIPWFVGKDVATALGYANSSEAIAYHVDDEDKLNSKNLLSFPLNLGQRGGWIINESGLYALILACRLPVAKPFKHWVTGSVLPFIRQTGGYVTEGQLARIVATQLANPQKAESLFQALGQMAILRDVKSASYGLRKTAKLLGVPERLFLFFLKEAKLAYQHGQEPWMPTANMGNHGYAYIRSVGSKTSDFHGTQMMITPLGRLYLSYRLYQAFAVPPKVLLDGTDD